MSAQRVRADEVRVGDLVIGPWSIMRDDRKTVADPNQTCKYPGKDRLIGFVGGGGIAVAPDVLLQIIRAIDD